MAGVFDWARFVTGDRSDPEQDLGTWSDEEQKRNRAAIGLDANGNPLPAPPDAPPAAGPNGAAVNPAAAGAAAAQAQSTLPPNQEPNATKTPVSLGHLMMNLQQYNEREQGFNQSLGMGVAALSQPRNREMVSKMFNVPVADPLKFGQAMMDTNVQQQGQDRANAITTIANDPIKGPALATQLHMDWGALKAGLLADPGMAGKIAQALGTPTDALRNLTQLQHMGGGAPGGAASPEMRDITSGVVSGVAGPENAAMISAQQAWRDAHKGQPDSAMPWRPNDLANFKQWQANEASNEADRLTASSELVDKNEAALTLKGDLEELKDSPGLHSILTTPGKRDVALKALNDGTVSSVPAMMARWGLSNDEAKAVALLRRIGGTTTETAMKGMAGTGTRVTQAEVGPLKDAINMTQNLNQSYEDYVHGAINNAVTKTKRAIAANYGATGNIKNMDPEFAPWLNNTFKKGGQLYKEGSGADDLAPDQPIPADEIAEGKRLLADKPYLRDEMIDNWQQRGLDVSKLRGKNPSKW